MHFSFKSSSIFFRFKLNNIFVPRGNDSAALKTITFLILTNFSISFNFGNNKSIITIVCAFASLILLAILSTPHLGSYPT